MIEKEELFKIGKFAKPHGVKGEISLLTTFDLLDETGAGDSDGAGAGLFLVCEMEGICVPFFIESCRYKTDNVTLVKLENVDSDEAAKVFMNQEVHISTTLMNSASSTDGITFDNFIGYKVIDEAKGYLGDITDVDESTQNILFSINYNGGELLLPAVEDFIINVDHKEKSLTTNIPDGLFDL